MNQAPDREQAERIVDAGVRAYFAARRSELPGFVERTFSLSATLRLHRHALGFDLLRAPANVFLVLLAVLGNVLAWLLMRTGWRAAADWLRRRQWFLSTDVGREIEWRIYTELLRLPVQQPGRESSQDALAQCIREQTELASGLDNPALLAQPRLRAQLRQALAAYTGTRAAAAEIANAFLLTGTGAVAFGQLTPGALSFGPALAVAAAQQAAIASFPLGTTLGGLWYGVFPAEPTTGLVVATTAGLLLAVSCTAAFSGVIGDPLQRRLGLHERRLRRLLDTLEGALLGRHEHYAPRDYYVSRVIDLLEIARSVLRQLP